MTSGLDWGAETITGDVVERSFLLRRPAQPAVPGVVWLPAGSSDGPLVLLCHGGSGHKRTERHVRMAHWLVSRAGLCCAAIDGPQHGDRVPAPLAPEVYQQLIVDEGIEQVTARMTGDWLATVSALAGLGLADDNSVSVFALSMGARFAIPVASALGPRLRCAVFGKFGLRQSGLLHPGLCCPEVLAAAAGAIAAPVLFYVRWDDELFPRDGQFDLFAALAGEKLLLARPGPHAGTHPDDEAAWLTFLAGHGR